MGWWKTVEHEDGRKTTIRRTVNGGYAAEKGGWLGPERIGYGDTVEEAEQAAKDSRGSPIKK
jgi:hypothetical protein